MKKIIQLRLKVTEEKHGEMGLPRVVHLCREFNFTEHETELFMYVVAKQTGIERESKFEEEIDAM